MCCGCAGASRCASQATSNHDHSYGSSTSFPFDMAYSTDSPTTYNADMACNDTDDGHKSENGDGCDYFNGYPEECGNGDTEDFSSCRMCCGCAGASRCASQVAASSTSYYYSSTLT